jgi:site-specific DNA-methyltransferase (adenine-specific)
MYRITEKQFNEMPSELQELYEKLPNPSRDEVVGLFPNSKGASSQNNNSNGHIYRGQSLQESKTSLEGYRDWYNDNGSASRFFYCAKASKRERNIGCEGLEEKPKVFNGQSDKPSEDMKDVEKRFTTLPVANFHPTVKPLALMEYLVKLVSRERQVVLDPFMGSGTTGMACVNTGRDFIGIEIDEDYFKIAQARIESCKESRQLTFE